MIDDFAQWGAESHLHAACFIVVWVVSCVVCGAVVWRAACGAWEWLLNRLMPPRTVLRGTPALDADRARLADAYADWKPGTDDQLYAEAEEMWHRPTDMDLNVRRPG